MQIKKGGTRPPFKLPVNQDLNLLSHTDQNHGRNATVLAQYDPAGAEVYQLA